MTKENRADLHTLIEMVKSMTFAEFIEYIKSNSTSVRELGNGLIDFEFRSLTATLYKYGIPYLTKSFDCWDEFGSLETSIMINSKTYFKR